MTLSSDLSRPEYSIDTQSSGQSREDARSSLPMFQSGSQSAVQRINAVFENSPFAVFGVDADGRIGYWNERCSELFRLPGKASIVGKHCSDLLCGGDTRCETRCCTECAINQNIKSEKQINDYQLNIQQADGNEIRVNIATCYFYQNDPAEVSTYFSICQLPEELPEELAE